MIRNGSKGWTCGCQGANNTFEDNPVQAQELGIACRSDSSRAGRPIDEGKLSKPLALTVISYGVFVESITTNLCNSNGSYAFPFQYDEELGAFIALLNNFLQAGSSASP